MNQITTEINKSNSKIDAIEQQLKKPFKAWTEGEKEEFGNHEQLRKNEMQLRKKEEQLIELLILQEKDKQQLHSQESINKNLFEAGIVYLITAGSKKRKRIEWGEVSAIDQLSYDPNSILFKLDTIYLAETGLAPEKLVLYCRPTFHEQFKFLRERVIENSVLGWILGPPGTGKSTTALAFASTLDRAEWTITWIHLSRSNFAVCVRLEGVSKKYCKIERINLDKISDILEEEVSKQHIVFIDGYTLSEFRHQEVQMECYAWLEGRKNRRLVIVCSMSRRYKAKLEEDKMVNLEEFLVYSWKFEEYNAAVDEVEFFNSVSHQLHSSNAFETNAEENPSPSRYDLILSKFYFAGGCSRFMFQYTTDEVISVLEESVDSIRDVEGYCKATTGDRSNGVINRLFGLHLIGKSRKKSKSFIISQFACYCLAVKLGPDLINHLSKVIEHDSNPVMKGWLFEMWFFACLRNGGVTLIDIDGRESLKWPQASSIERLDMESVQIIPDDTGLWLKPLKWNQGGFDAVFIYASCETPNKPRNFVRFVQVTCGQTHTFKIQYFRELLTVLGNHFEIHFVEVFFLVEQAKIGLFEILDSQIYGQGGLREFGWEKNKEKENVQIYALKGWK